MSDAASRTSSNVAPRLDHAIRLVEYLRRMQELKTPAIRTTDSYEAVWWLADVPEGHGCVTTVLSDASPDPDAPIMMIDRVPQTDPPELPEQLRPWVSGVLSDPTTPPAIRRKLRFAELETLADDTLTVADGDASLEENPTISELFEQWLSAWTRWSEREVADRPVRKIYQDLFSTHAGLENNPEDLELRIGVGLLMWKPADHPVVKRHLLTKAADLNFDDTSGQLTVQLRSGESPLALELDMLDPHLVASPQRIQQLTEDARAFEGSPLDRDELGDLARRVVYTLDANASYIDTTDKPTPGKNAAATLAPALILRRRSQRGIIDIYHAITNQLRDAENVPAGLMPLIDPDFTPPATADPTPGGLIVVDNDPYLPLPVNEKQLQIIQRVDHYAQTVVQGPPGTGKTHTAAALLSHLLAQGKRVLVTSQTDRALKEVRDKLPAAIKPLSVAVVGASREDMSDLKTAVETIARRADEHDPARSASTLDEALGRIDQHRRARADAYGRLRDSREHETLTFAHGEYEGTLASIALQYQQSAEKYGWISQYGLIGQDSVCPLTNEEVAKLLELLRDTALDDDEGDARSYLPPLGSLTTPSEFATNVRTEADAQKEVAQHSAESDNDMLGPIQKLAPQDRHALQQHMRVILDKIDNLAHRQESWMSDALADTLAGRTHIWTSRARQIQEKIQQLAPLVDQLEPFEVEVQDCDRGAIEALATGLLNHLTSSQIKTLPDGRPKVGAFSPKIVKQSGELFDKVRVNSKPATTSDQLNALLRFLNADRILDTLDRAWPVGVEIPPEDTLRERLDWHIEESRQLDRVLSFGELLAEEEASLRQVDIPKPDWTDLNAVRAYGRMVDAINAQDRLDQARQPLIQLENHLDTLHPGNSPSCMRTLTDAVQSRDHQQYATAYARLVRLHDAAESLDHREALLSRFATASHVLADAVKTSASDTEWDSRLAHLTQAWDWAATGRWILSQDSADVNALQAKITAIDQEIRRDVETVASTRAWQHALSADRMTGTARADLKHYAQRVQKYGKGTGKYASRQRQEIKKAMDRCRPAVPVWIMPLYRIAEQLDVSENMFDVVIVDEASQAGIEATFLQYLAPKIVVIGDDRQVSPSAVGVDQQDLRDLADQYLAGDRYKSAWLDPGRSFFDDAVMRYGNKITLVEHRRCVPRNHRLLQPHCLRTGRDTSHPGEATRGRPPGADRGGAYL